MSADTCRSPVAANTCRDFSPLPAATLHCTIRQCRAPMRPQRRVHEYLEIVVTVDHGMNIAEVEALAVSLARAADETASLIGRIEKIISNSAWVGADATRFKQQRWPSHRDQLRSISGGLSEFARTARANATEQSRASEAGTAAASGSVAAAVTLAGLPGRWKWERTPGELWRAGKGDRDVVDPNDVVQGELGDCYLLANLKVIAQRDPGHIRRMIDDNGDGTYTVTFFENGRPSTITITDEFPTKVKPGWFDDRTPFAKNGDGELWVRVIEKAYAEKFREGYGSVSSGQLPVALEHLSGLESYSMLPASMSDAQLDSLGSDLSRGAALVTTGTPNTVTSELTELFRSKRIVAGHAYAVERIDTEQNLVYLDNPWGKLDLVLTYDEYRRAFNQLHQAATTPSSDATGAGN